MCDELYRWLKAQKLLGNGEIYSRRLYSTFSEEDRQRWRDLGIRFWDVDIGSIKWTCFVPKWGEPEVFEFQAIRDFRIFYRDSKGK
jgi:hypothetical protein